MSSTTLAIFVSFIAGALVGWWLRSRVGGE